jgi:serine/threonine protein kinase/TolB-like protein/Flp pilus assembly protein TadD
VIGRTVAHYQILEKLGEGGMGVVYKAQDTKLDRLVALKFLPHHLTANEAEKSRFLQEAKAASALNHPNVCTIYGIEEHEGSDGKSQHFIEMEFVDGVTLRDKIPSEGLRTQGALTYAIQIGEALTEAHSKGIVHRDIKCENIMVNSKNQVKVMDFGLAKLKGSLKLTRTSSTAGTLAYMSPEQIEGGDVDTRSDIFSFGVVFYEMLTGHLPFRGEHEAAMMYSIVNEEPIPADKFRPDLSAECLHILRKALEKDPEDRYQHAVDMVVDLRRIKKQSTRVSRSSMTQEMMRPSAPKEPTSSAEEKTVPVQRPRKKLGAKTYAVLGTTLVVVAAAAFFLLRRETSGSADTDTGKRMLAVLPFENLGALEQEYFADGLTEEVTNRLSGLSGLGVIARTSALEYKKTTKTLRQIGSELGVGYVLQGTIRWGTSGEGGTRIRVSPVLVKVSDGTQVWAQSYEVVFSDVFKIQSDIASQVAGALGVTLLQPERQSLEASHTENSEAYDFYLRGNDYSRRSYRQQDFQIAIQMYEKAVELDPKFSSAYARLSEMHSAMYWFHYDHTKERLAKAKAAVDEALRLDPDLPAGHASLGYYYYWGFLDYDNALREFALVQKSQPSDTRILLGVGSVQRRQGKFDLAAATMTKASELDPRSSELARNTSETYRLLRDYSNAEHFIDQAITLAPDLPEGYYEKALLELLWLGDPKPARAVIQQASSIAGAEGNMAILFTRAWIETFGGNYKEALAVASSGPEKPYDDQFQFIPKAQLLAAIHGLMGKQSLERASYDSARAVLEKRVKEQPDDGRFHSALGIAYAGLGRKEDAVREGKLGVELLPIPKEAWRGTYRVRDLARIYTMVGEQSAALDLLEDLLSRPSDLSGPWLRIDPTWTPLRDNPRFQKLIAEKK